MLVESKCEEFVQSLVEPGERVKLLETLQRDLVKTGARIPLIHEQFALMDKYEVPRGHAVSSLVIKNCLCTQCHRYRLQTTE